MTTSKLNTFTREFSDFDLQVLKDFALEAPYEWRLMFDQLIECADDSRKIDKVQEELDALKDSANKARMRLQTACEELDRLIPQNFVNITQTYTLDELKRLFTSLEELHTKFIEAKGEL